MNSKIKKLFSSILFVVIFLVLQKTGVLKQVELLGQDNQAVAEDSNFEKTAKQEEGYTLVRAVDGDTLVILDSEMQEKKVRLIGINTPETVDPRRPVECFGKEASNFTKELVSKSSKNVRLEFDDTQQKYDKYGRLLAYVYLVQKDGVEIFLNRELIKQGYAHEYTYKLPYKLQSEFKKLQQEAKQEERGLWGNVCN